MAKNVAGGKVRPDIQGWKVEDGTFRFSGEDREAIYARDPNNPEAEFSVIFGTKDDPASEEELLERLETAVLRYQVHRGDKGAEQRFAQHNALLKAKIAYRRALAGILPGPGDAALKGRD